METMAVMYYIASPYSAKGENRYAIEQQRYEQIREITARIMNKGILAFSPIVYGHEMAVKHGLPGDYKFWGDFCRKTLSMNDHVVVIMMDGWDQSSGIKGECDLADELGIPVTHIFPEEVDEYFDKLLRS